jgi:endonuclease YncB( thermonuclease family)
MDSQPYSGTETLGDGEAYAGALPYTTEQPYGYVQAPTDTPAPTETPYPTPTPALSATPAETPTSTPTAVAAEETVEPGESAEGEQAPEVAAATQLPAIPLDAIEAKVLRVLDGEVFEVVIEGDMDPDAVDAPSTPEVIPANFIARMSIGMQFTGWRSRSRTGTQMAQAEEPTTTVLIRYADIEIPALNTEEGAVAAAANRELIEGQTVFLEIADPNPDAEGVISAFVFLEDGELANAVMVREGHAVVSPTTSDSKYEARLIAAQTEAQETGSGMWAVTPAIGGEIAALPPATSEARSVTVPSATPSPTRETESPELAQSGGCVELVRNGGFEEGAAYWNLIDGERPPEITDAITFGDSNYALQLGIVAGENVASISAADQLIELPADAYSIVLSLRYFPIADPDPGPGDLQYVDVYNAQTGQFAGRVLSGQRGDAVWLAANYDMSQLAGQPIRVVFAVNNDGVAGSTAVIVDDVSVLACKRPGASGTRNEPQPEPSGTVEGAGAEAQVTPQTALTTESEKTQLAAGRPWLVQMFTGAVMLGILTIIGFGALVIMNSSTPASSGDQPEDGADD